jgi:hypothetical protein
MPAKRRKKLMGQLNDFAAELNWPPAELRHCGRGRDSHSRLRLRHYLDIGRRPKRLSDRRHYPEMDRAGQGGRGALTRATWRADTNAPRIPAKPRAQTNAYAVRQPPGQPSRRLSVKKPFSLI